MTGTKLKEQYISHLPFLQTLNNISVIMLLCTFNIISLILDMRKGDYVIISTPARSSQLSVFILWFSYYVSDIFCKF